VAAALRHTIIVAALLAAASAHAQPYPPITDRDYALDLYTGSAIGSVRVIGMGGASVALAQGSVGTLSNPAAAAVRRTTRSGNWAWDFHIDGQSAVLASDFDNNGLEDTTDASSQLATAGLVIYYGAWGVGVSATAFSTRIVEDDGDDSTVDNVLEPQGSIARIAIGRSFRGEAHTVGAALRFGSLGALRPREGLDELTLFTIAGPSAEAGYIWRPPRRSLRLGASFALPVKAQTLKVGDCDPLDCEGYILPERVEAPWMTSVGAAYRIAPSPWNQRVNQKYRDERSLLVAVDLAITGGVPDGHGLEAFARHMLQRSGEHAVVTARLGAEAELLPGWLRLRAGTYWEPARFEDSSGRLHGTAGVDVRLVEFDLFGSAYRLQVAATADVAARYGNTGVSLGFWN
jgi:hypothetical protein